MALKGVDPGKTISVYDPQLGAYHEVSEDQLKLQMKSLGLTDHEVEEKINKLKKGGGA